MGLLWIYAALLAASLGLYVARRKRRGRRDAGQLHDSREAGLAEPASLHPVTDPSRCIGSGSCATACPEGALGVVDGRAVLVNASACIGHGACLAACPTEAIKLVFGTQRRGVDIPHLSAEFETNVPGVFIAGELGGMGLIRKAVEQGRQAMSAIARRRSGDFDLDVVIVGCGPAGLSAGLSAMQHGLRYRIIEQESSLGGAVFHYPRHKITMTAAFELAMVGKLKLGEVKKEDLLRLWQDIVERTGLRISFEERMEAIERGSDGGFAVRTNRGTHRARCVLLAMGRRGTPRKLEVPGEESAKVVYRLIDPAQYAGQSVLVVGGGDSAIEAAAAVGEQPGTKVTLSYRGEAFSRVKPKNRSLIEACEREGRVRVLLDSQVRAIEPRVVRIAQRGEERAWDNDAVIVCAGGQLPTPLLQQAGIRFDTKFGSA